MNLQPLNSAQVFELATSLRQCALALGEWRIARVEVLSREIWDQLDDQEMTLLNSASDLYTTGIGLVLDETTVSLQGLRDSLQRARAAIHRLADAREALKVVASLLLLAAALTAGSLAGMANALLRLDAAVTTA